MKKHKTKYDNHALKQRARDLLGVLPINDTSDAFDRVRKGKTNEGARLLSEEMQEKMEAKWKLLAEPVTGYGSYKEMRAGINKELGRSFGAV